VSSARRIRAGCLTEALRRKVAGLPRVTARPAVLSGFPASLAFLADRRALSLDLRALPRGVCFRSTRRHEQPSPRPSRTWIMPEGSPLQSLSRPPGWPYRSAVGAGSLRSPCPSTTSLARAPYAADRPGPPRFRPRGFSPPRRFPGSARARGFVAPRCRPWAAFSLQSVPLASGRAPLVGAAGSLAVLPGLTPVRRARSCHPDLHRLGRRSGVVPGRILPWLEAPFQPRSSPHLAAERLARPPGHPGPRAPDPPRSGRSVDFGAFFPARVRSQRAATDPRVSSRVGDPCGSPRTGRCSPGRSSPLQSLAPA
jgi:hypothetical protein